MPLRAAFFDVGDTLVEHWAPRDVVGQKARARVCAAIGEPPWLDAFLEADIEPGWMTPTPSDAPGPGRAGWWRFEPDQARQETERWYREWFRSHGITTDGIDLDRLRSAMCVALEEISTPVAGAFDSVRWCAQRGMRVVLVTNTLSRGDAEALDDWRRFGLADAIHGIVSSHSAGWRKPHPAIFERALEIADAGAQEAFHVGDNLIADVWGAGQLGIKTVWRRTDRARPPTDERGEPAARAERDRTATVCRHPSEHLRLASDVVCSRCGEPAGIAIRPDAIVDDLTELAGVVGAWISG